MSATRAPGSASARWSAATSTLAIGDVASSQQFVRQWRSRLPGHRRRPSAWTRRLTCRPSRSSARISICSITRGIVMPKGSPGGPASATLEAALAGAGRGRDLYRAGQQCRRRGEFPRAGGLRDLSREPVRHDPAPGGESRSVSDGKDGTGDGTDDGAGEHRPPRFLRGDPAHVGGAVLRRRAACPPVAGKCWGLAPFRSWSSGSQVAVAVAIVDGLRKLPAGAAGRFPAQRARLAAQALPCGFSCSRCSPSI